jgi:hypothetical protein
MDLNKYSELRDKIKSQDFETKNKDVDTWLNIFSYVGNIGSIFFAFFLVFPALLLAISANLVQGEASTYLAGFISVLILSGFELLKRKVLANLSFDIVKNKFKIQKSLIGWAIFSVGIVSASFYFSLNGAINFASTSRDVNVQIENTAQVEIDSINLIYQERKQTLIDDNNSYRKSNTEYRDKIADTPLNYRTVRNELQDLVDSNNESIADNDTRITSIDNELNGEIRKLQTKQESEQAENEDNDISNILLFLIISTSIEFIIILGIYFDKYYDYNVYLTNIAEMETTHKKRDRYRTLLKFIFKEGMLGQDQKILGKTKLLVLIKEKSSIASPNKFLDNFLNDMEYLGIIKLNGTRRLTAVTYQDALEKIDKFDDTLRLLEKLN